MAKLMDSKESLTFTVSKPSASAQPRGDFSSASALKFGNEISPAFPIFTETPFGARSLHVSRIKSRGFGTIASFRCGNINRHFAVIAGLMEVAFHKIALAVIQRFAIVFVK